MDIRRSKWTTKTSAAFRDDGYNESSCDVQRRTRQSAMMATAKQVTNKDERGVPRTTVANIMAMSLFQSHPRHPIALPSDVDLALAPKTSNHIANRGTTCNIYGCHHALDKQPAVPHPAHTTQCFSNCHIPAFSNTFTRLLNAVSATFAIFKVGSRSLTPR